MANNVQASEKDVSWYNKFYEIEQTGLTPWYEFMLPELVRNIKHDEKILELGCGQSKGLRYLFDNNYARQENLFGTDQSDEAINLSKIKLPRANLEKGDIYQMNFPDSTFDHVLMMEVIEHLEDPRKALHEVARVVRPGGELVVSFPNYINIPWLIVRILAEKFNKPNWIVLQPVDKIYTTVDVVKYCENEGFKFVKCIGANYFPPLLWKYERRSITKLLNALRLYHLSFHPILFFKKTCDL